VVALGVGRARAALDPRCGPRCLARRCGGERRQRTTRWLGAQTRRRQRVARWRGGGRSREGEGWRWRRRIWGVGRAERRLLALIGAGLGLQGLATILVVRALMGLAARIAEQAAWARTPRGGRVAAFLLAAAAQGEAGRSVRLGLAGDGCLGVACLACWASADGLRIKAGWAAIGEWGELGRGSWLAGRPSWARRGEKAPGRLLAAYADWARKKKRRWARQGSWAGLEIKRNDFSINE
jgi:hypothetical protein